MNTLVKDYQTQLELKRVLTSNRVQQLAIPNTDLSIDPINQQLLQQMYSKLSLIEKAQARIVSGEFGFCQICQQPIEPERLEIFPYTEHCASCKRSVERSILHSNRNTN